MADSPISRLIEATIDAQNPDKVYERKHASKLLTSPLLKQWSQMKHDLRQERKELRADVDAGLITPDEMNAQLESSSRLVEAFGDSLQEMLN